MELLGPCSEMRHGVAHFLSLMSLLLELSDLGQTVRKFRNLAGRDVDALFFACFHTLAAAVALELVDHMDELRLSFDAVLRTYIHTVTAACADCRIDVDHDEGLADTCRTVLLLDVCLVLGRELRHGAERDPRTLLSHGAGR